MIMDMFISKPDENSQVVCKIFFQMEEVIDMRDFTYPHDAEA